MNSRYRTRSGRRFGFSLLETALALGITGLAMSSMISSSNDASKRVAASAVADRILQVQAAAEAYMRQNGGKLNGVLTATGQTARIQVAKTTAAGTCADLTLGGQTFQCLQNAGFLPQSLVDRNSYGQSMSLIVRKTGTNLVEGMLVTSGGRPIPDEYLGQIITKIGAGGGAITATSIGGSGTTSVRGTGGGWTATSTQWSAGGVAPTVGRPVASLAFTQNTNLADWLYRYEIPGAPQANQMNASINMRGVDNTRRNLNNAGDVDTMTLRNSETGGRVTVNSGLTAGVDAVINGPTTMNGTATVAGAATLNGPTTVNNSARVNGYTTLNGETNVTGGNLLRFGNTAAGQDGWLRMAGNDWVEVYAPAGLFSHRGLYAANGNIVAAAADTYITAPDGFVSAGKDITAGRNITALNGGVNAPNGNISAGYNMYAQAYYDANDASGYYRLDPTSTSVVFDLVSRGTITATDGTNYSYMNNGNMFASNNVSAGGSMHSPIFIDREDGNYYVDPNGTSVFNTAYYRGQINLPGIASRGNPCAPWGAIASDGNGRTMSCVNGVWLPIGAQAKVTHYTLPSYAYKDDPMWIGWHYYCALAGGFEYTPFQNQPNAVRVLPYDGPNYAGLYNWGLSRGTSNDFGGSATCID